MGLIYLWISTIGLILLGFGLYYLFTGVTPIEFWQATEGTIVGSIITFLFLTAFVISMLIFASKAIFPRR